MALAQPLGSAGHADCRAGKWHVRGGPGRATCSGTSPAYLQGKSDRFERWRTTPGSTILSGDRWKLIHFHGDGRGERPWVELYDLETDPRETRDLAADQPERVRELRSRLDRWRGEVGATNARPR